MNLATIRREFLEVPLELIDAPVLPSRSTMDEQALDELTESIRAIGLQQPIILARVGERFEVVAGDRRTRACRGAALVKVPAIVYPSKDVALEAVKYAENRHREELSAADEAIWFAELLERDCGNDTDRLAAQLGEKRAYVEGRLALLLGDPDVFRALQDNRITIGVAQQLNRCTDAVHRRYLLDLSLRNGATVAIVSGWLAEWRTIHEPATRNLQPGARAEVPPPVPLGDAFTCALCSSKDNPSSMRPVQMHDYCQHAMLKPALELWQRRSDFMRAPRTAEEAIELVNDLCDRFPTIAEPVDPRRI